MCAGVSAEMAAGAAEGLLLSALGPVVANTPSTKVSSCALTVHALWKMWFQGLPYLLPSPICPPRCLYGHFTDLCVLHETPFSHDALRGFAAVQSTEEP